LVAGYETILTCLSWTLYLIAFHPHIQDKLAEEVLRVIGKDKKPTGERREREWEERGKRQL
jgi:cytochrome P450